MSAESLGALPSHAEETRNDSKHFRARNFATCIASWRDYFAFELTLLAQCFALTTMLSDNNNGQLKSHFNIRQL
jgi:hypothetical protein